MKMVMSTLATIVLIVKTGKANLSGQMEIPIRDNSARTCGRASDRCTGAMEAFTKVNGSEDFPMAKVWIHLTKLGMFKAKG